MTRWTCPPGLRDEPELAGSARSRFGHYKEQAGAVGHPNGSAGVIARRIKRARRTIRSRHGHESTFAGSFPLQNMRVLPSGDQAGVVRLDCEVTDGILAKIFSSLPSMLATVRLISSMNLPGSPRMKATRLASGERAGAVSASWRIGAAGRQDLAIL